VVEIVRVDAFAIPHGSSLRHALGHHGWRPTGPQVPRLRLGCHPGRADPPPLTTLGQAIRGGFAAGAAVETTEVRSDGTGTGPSVTGRGAKANPVYAARYHHLTTREHNTLTPTQAQTVIAAAILRHLHAVITTGTAWDPSIATHGTHPRRQPPIAA
jgi:hypothetical protein